ncbi:glutamate receptor ionotropic, delta-1-like [Dermacentor albipictus]|uniref:glutamate receptor ionotropic, delta-1-like n=1 Tax=Dermacentor albipictus TaxID=60249 RepID=UPI0038FC306A
MTSNATHLRVTFATAPPWVQPVYRGEDLYVAGMFGHILQALADFVPFSYDIVYDPRRSFGVRLTNGSYNGIIGLLHSGGADLAAAPVIVRYDRAEVVTYTPPMYSGHCALIAVAGEPSVNAFSYLFVFDWQVWAMLVACIPLVAAAVAFVEHRRLRTKGSFVWETYENTWDILRSFSYEGHTTKTKSHAGRLLFSIWWLTVLVLTNGFAGQLKASMAIKTEPPRFQSAIEIAYQTAIRPLMWKDTVFEVYVRTSTRPDLRALTSLVRRHGGFVPITDMYSEGAMKDLYSGRAVIISDRDVSMHMLAKQCRLTGGSLYVAPEELFTHFMTVAHSKRLPRALERRIHGKIRAMIESGLHAKWYDDGVEDWHRCQGMQKASASHGGELSFKVLRYDDVAAVFTLWAIMAALSLIVFLLELCVHRTATLPHRKIAPMRARRKARCIARVAAR